MASTNVALVAKTKELIGEAVAADAQGRHADALGHYNSALKSVAELRGECSGQQRAALDAKYCEYLVRAGQLLRQLAGNAAHHADLDRAGAALHEARVQHACGNMGAALSLYAGSIGRYQKILRLEKAAPADRPWCRELRRFATLCLTEAERAKATGSGAPAAPLELVPPDQALQHKLSGLSLGASTPAAGEGLLAPIAAQRRPSGSPGGTDSPRSSTSGCAGSSPGPSPRDSTRDSPRAGSSPAADSLGGSMADRLTAEEADVVRTTSHVNGLTFLPWVDNDSSEKFGQREAFTDKDGLLMLSAKQQRKLGRWQRASQLYADPPIFGHPGCAHIVQET
ncbi:calpain 7, partial [Coemansia nantahalensis]